MSGVEGEGSSSHLWTRDLVLATAVNALVMTIFYLLMTTMAVYATRQFGASATGAGLASSMFIVGAVVTRLAGGLVDAAGPRRALLAGLAVFVTMSLAYLRADDLALVLLVRFVHGAAFGIVSTAATTLAQSSIPPLRRAEGTGYYSMSVPLASGVGPLLALWLIDRWEYEALFIASAAISTAAVAVAALLRPAAGRAASPRSARPARGGPSARPRWHSAVHPHVVPLAAFMLLVGVVNAAVITYAHPFAVTLGIADAAGPFFLVQALAVVGARLVAGRVQDRRGDNVVVYPALAVYAAGLTVLSQAGGTPALLLAGGLVGAGFGTLMPAVQAAVVRLARGRRVGMAVSTYYLFLDVGTGLGPLGLGLLIAAADHRLMYLSVAGLALVSAVYYHVVHGRLRPAARA